MSSVLGALPRLRAVAFELGDEHAQVAGNDGILQVVAARTVQDEGREGVPLLGLGLHVLELHVLQLLDHALVEGTRLLEGLTPDLLVLRREDLDHEEVVALGDPADRENDQQSADNRTRHCEERFHLRTFLPRFLERDSLIEFSLTPFRRASR